MTELNWALLNNPDFAGSALQGYSAGQKVGKQRRVEDATAAYMAHPDDPNAMNEMIVNAPEQLGSMLKVREFQRGAEARQAAAPMVAKGDYRGAAQTVLAADPESADRYLKMYNSLTEDQKRITDIGSAAWAAAWPEIKKLPKGTGARQQAYANLVAPHLHEAGAKDDQINAALPNLDSDEWGEANYRLALGADKVLAQQNSDRDFGLRRTDTEGDNARADLLAGNTIEHNRTMEGFERSRVGIAAASEHRQATQGDGSGKAPSGYRWAPDGTLQAIPGGPADPAVAASNKNLRVVPSSAQAGLSNNRQALSRIDQAIKAIEKNPGALGLKNVVGDTVMQRIDPRGVDVRARVADIGSQKMHDRSGAAVTLSEAPRLRPFIPDARDTPDAALQKLKNLKAQYEQAVDEAESFYGPENGYRPVTHGGGAAPKSGGRPPLSSFQR